MKKISILLLVLAIAGGMSLFAGGQQEAETKEKQEQKEEEEPVRVAAVFPGSIKDQGWNQNGYSALMDLKEKYNLKVSYQESVSQGEVKDSLRSYAADGYDFVIAHDLYFMEPAGEVAKEFPEVWFGVSYGWKGGDNLISITASNWESSYLAGALAGLRTKSNKIGILTATDSPVAQKMVAGFKNGAKRTNEGVKVIHAYVGSWDDVVKGKELVRSMISEDADIVYTQCGQVNTGAVEAAKEGGVKAIGAIVDMSDIAPDTVIASAVAPPGGFIKNMIKMYMEGDIEGKAYHLGIEEGVEDLVINPRFKEQYSQKTLDTIERLRQKIIDEEITAPEVE